VSLPTGTTSRGQERRKMQNKKEMFLVQWDDEQGSKSWVPAEDVTDFAIQQYYKAKEAKKKKRRRRCQ